MIQIILNFSFSGRNSSTIKKLFALAICVFAHTQGIQSAALNDSIATEVSVRGATVAVNPGFVQAIREEYAVFQMTRSGVSTPVDFLDCKAAQLKSSTTAGSTIPASERVIIALTIQYVLRGHVFSIAPAQPSEAMAINTTYAYAAILASSVHGIDASSLPDFSPTITGDGYHQALVKAAEQRVVPSDTTPTLLGSFVAALADQERSTIIELVKAPQTSRGGTSPTSGGGTVRTVPVTRTPVQAANSSDDDGGCCSWCCCFGGKKKKQRTTPRVSLASSLNGDSAQPLLTKEGDRPPYGGTMH